MPHITLEDPGKYGIGGLLAYRPRPARPLLELAEVLLREPNSLSQGERELIVTYVSTLNKCTWSLRIHAAFAAALLDGGHELVDAVCRDPRSAPIPGKLRALLELAAVVTRSGKEVDVDLVEAARREGAMDEEIHDTVLIAAAFCMFNRYVSGLGALVPPEDDAIYGQLTDIRLRRGYLVLGGVEE